VYKEITSYDEETGYHMGVYLCLGQQSHSLTHKNSTPFSIFGTFAAIEELLKERNKIYIFLAESKHKIKKKAEQRACKKAIGKINK
jgi:hypothetical protein